MSLNNNQMLPERIRKMRQMKDILDVEDIVLCEIDKVINEMYERATLLHEELVNEEWLETNLGQITGAIVDVSKRENLLHVEISVCVPNMEMIVEEQVIAFINKWLPAHLAYSIHYDEYMKARNNVAIVWLDDEIITMRQVNV